MTARSQTAISSGGSFRLRRENSTDPFQRARDAFRLWPRLETESSVSRDPAIMRQSRKFEGFGSPFAMSVPARHGEPPELDAAGPARVERQADCAENRGRTAS